MRVRLFAGLSLAAALLAAFAALQALPLQAQSTTVTLVSNTHLSPSAFPASSGVLKSLPRAPKLMVT